MLDEARALIEKYERRGSSKPSMESQTIRTNLRPASGFGLAAVQGLGPALALCWALSSMLAVVLMTNRQTVAGRYLFRCP